MSDTNKLKYDDLDASLPEDFSPTEEFLSVLESIINGPQINIVFGGPGTGKSTLIAYIFSELKQKMKIAKLAPTGIAAQNIQGSTIHSFFKIDPKNKYASIDPRSELVIRNTNLLIIDEISMVKCQLLENIDRILKSISGNNEAFGGIRVLFVGDLFQLQPVPDNRDDDDENYNPEKKKYEEDVKSFFYASSLVNSCDTVGVFKLTKCFRQQRDPEFLMYLNKIRDTTIPRNELQLFYLLCNRALEYDSKKTTHIVTRNRDADAWNEINLKYLTDFNHALTFHPLIINEKAIPKSEKRQLKADLTVCPGARVLFIKNSPDRKWVNGTTGIVEECNLDFLIVNIQGENVRVEPQLIKTGQYRYNEETDELERNEVAIVIRYPLTLGWAITVHRCQGMTLSSAELRLHAVWAPGQFYVAVSRVRSFQDLRIFNSPKLEYIKQYPNDLVEADNDIRTLLYKIRSSKEYGFTEIILKERPSQFYERKMRKRLAVGIHGNKDNDHSQKNIFNDY